MKLLTMKQMADKLQISPETLRRWVREGRLPILRPTKRTLRFDEEAVDKVLRKGVKTGV